MLQELLLTLPRPCAACWSLVRQHLHLHASAQVLARPADPLALLILRSLARFLALSFLVSLAARLSRQCSSHSPPRRPRAHLYSFRRAAAFALCDRTAVRLVWSWKLPLLQSSAGGLPTSWPSADVALVRCGLASLSGNQMTR